MTNFQWGAVLVLTPMLLRCCYRLATADAGRRAMVVQATVIVLAGVAILNPRLIQWLAELFGIGRGADVVLYVSVLFMIGIAFRFHTRCEQLQSDVTEVARLVALQNARNIDERTETEPYTLTPKAKPNAQPNFTPAVPGDSAGGHGRRVGAQKGGRSS